MCSAIASALNNDTILSVKTRIGDFSGNNIANRLLDIDIRAEPSLDNIVLHGRTAKQRYQKQADWNSLASFNKLLKEYRTDINFVGNGDIYHWEDVEHHILNG